MKLTKIVVLLINFISTLKDELQGLEKMRDGSNVRKFLDHEDEQERIKAIFSRIDEATKQFEVHSMSLYLFISPHCHYYVACARYTGLQDSAWSRSGRQSNGYISTCLMSLFFNSFGGHRTDGRDNKGRQARYFQVPNTFDN